MNEYREQAIKKLEEGCKSGKFDRYAAAMKDAVHEQLIDFCGQDYRSRDKNQTPRRRDSGAG